MEIRFNVAAGVSGPVSAAPVDLSGIRPAVAPAGRIKTEIFDKLNGAYSEFQKMRIALTYFALRDEGFLDDLDALYIRGRTIPDTMLNWNAKGQRAVNNGASLTAGVGMVTNGTSSWIDLKFAPQKYSLTSASVFALVPLGTFFAANAPLIGRGAVSGNQVMRVYPRLGTTIQASARLNATGGVLGNRAGAEYGGMWASLRNGDRLRLYQDDYVVADAQIAPTDLPSGIGIGAEGTTVFGAAQVSAFGYGGYIAPERMTRLRAILLEHHRFI